MMSPSMPYVLFGSGNKTDLWKQNPTSFPLFYILIMNNDDKGEKAASLMNVRPKSPIRFTTNSGLTLNYMAVLS
jgi:hypothetical protein